MIKYIKIIYNYLFFYQNKIIYLLINKVIVLTSKGTIYRSEDRGRQWSKMSEVFTRKALVALAADTDDRVGIVSNIVASSVDKNLVMFTGSESVSWVSQDCG